MSDFRLGKESSFSEVFNQLYPALCFFALKITRDQPAAEDIAEESFIKIWERRGQFYQFNVLKSYLYNTVRNSSINWLRSQRRRKGVQQEMELHGNDAWLSPLDLMISAEVFREIHLALDKLPPRCRKIVTMLYIEGKKAKEVAQELQLSPGTVKSQRERGLMLLKKHSITLLLLLLFTGFGL